MITAIILAAGKSNRIDGNIPKQFLQINNRMIIDYSIKTFEIITDKIIIVVPHKWKSVIKNKYPQHNISFKKTIDLEVIGNWIKNKNPFIFESKHELDVLRSINISNEFNLNIWIKGSGYEYRRIQEIKKYNPYIILPLDYPITPDINDPYQALNYTTAELKHWDMAPDNPIVLSENNIDYSITSYGIDKKDFRKNLQRSIRRGLSEDDALAALTTIPARQMGVDNQLGKIKQGYIANLSIVDGNYFNSQSKIYSTWIDGIEYPIMPKYNIDIEGKWDLSIDGDIYKLELYKKGSNYSGKLFQDSTEYNLKKLNVKGRFITWQIQWNPDDSPSRFTGHILDESLNGNAYDLNKEWTAIKTGLVDKEDKQDTKEERSLLTVFYPEG